MDKVVITSAVRLPVGKFLGSLSTFTAPQLGAIVIKEALKKSNLSPDKVDEVIFGNVIQAGLGQNPARQAALLAGMPDTVNAFTVNKVCGSGLKAVMVACQAIKSEDIEIAVAGGMESMSQAPYYITGYRDGVKFGDQKIIDGMILDGLTCPIERIHMGLHAEFTAKNSNISREEQDKFAFSSHQKAIKAQKEGKFDQEIVFVEIPQKKGEPIIFKTDEGPREDTSLEKLSKLKPAFDPTGTVTAGNASSLNDGAAAVVVMSEKKSNQLGIKPLAEIIGYTSAHTEPKRLFYAPIYAIRNLLQKTGLKLEDIDLFELNEAFASQVLADVKELGIPQEKLNVHGGGIALGHPIGASGARVLVTLIYALKSRNLKKGIAALCLGGGGACAMLIEIL